MVNFNLISPFSDTARIYLFMRLGLLDFLERMQQNNRIAKNDEQLKAIAKRIRELRYDIFEIFDINKIPNSPIKAVNKILDEVVGFRLVKEEQITGSAPSEAQYFKLDGLDDDERVRSHAQWESERDERMRSRLERIDAMLSITPIDQTIFTDTWQDYIENREAFRRGEREFKLPDLPDGSGNEPTMVLLDRWIKSARYGANASSACING